MLCLLQQEGHYVFIATGRPYAFLDKHILEFGFDGYILMNGPQVIINDQMIHSKPMDNQFMRKLVEMFENKGIQYVLEDDKHCYLDEKSKDFYSFYERINIPRDCFKCKYDAKQLDVYKVEVFCPSEDILNECIEFIKQYPEYGYFHSIHCTHLELYFKESHKASGILKVLEYLNIPIENSYAFGDGVNDIEMLSTVGCGIAMGNASDEVKKYAKKVTDTVCNDSVAVGVEKYILNCMTNC